jgi:hypothetical protein
MGRPNSAFNLSGVLGILKKDAEKALDALNNIRPI